MSRHKLVKNLDLDEELDDYDGDGYDDEEEETLRLGTLKVREILGGGVESFSDKDIQDSLYHYYYDVQKTVDYLLRAQTAEKPKKKVTGRFDISLQDVNGVAGGDGNAGYGGFGLEPEPFSFKDFFKDAPWLNIPVERQTVFISPIQPKGGLLGGSSSGAPKLSKLQALAAARKKKAEEGKSGPSSGVEKPMAALSLSAASEAEAKHSARGFPLRKRKDSNPHEKAPPPAEMIPEPQTEDLMDLPPVDQLEPSAFANTMFSSTSRSSPAHATFFTLPYTATAAPSSANPFAGPSPDDVVKAAQSKASGKATKGPPKTNGEKKASQITNGVEAMKIDDTPRATSKNLDVLREFEKMEKKNEANFVVIGHVDAGKSTLMGRLLLDLKVVDQRTVEKYRKEAEAQGKSSFALAWVLDQGTEERARGVTIDIATNKFSTAKTNFTTLDAPGHRDFIPNMIAGASQADFAVLVIDASTGSFESGLKGQTKEHALLVKSMGVSRMIIAVNKLDTVGWSEDRFTEISQQVGAFLTAAGFKPQNLAFIPCSGLNGDNIVCKSTESTFSWYNGPTLVEELDNSEPITRALTKPLRITIGDIFRGGQNPLSISGRIEAGSVQVGDALLAQPANEKCFIKAVEIDTELVDWAVAGQNVTLHLSNIDPLHLKIGDVLCSPSSPIANVMEFTVKVLAFEFITPMQVDVHRGRLHTPGTVKQLVAVLDKDGKSTGKKKPRMVKPGEVARIVVTLDRAVPLEAPGRVVLRSGGATVGAGLLE